MQRNHRPKCPIDRRRIFANSIYIYKAGLRWLMVLLFWTKGNETEPFLNGDWVDVKSLLQ